MPRAAKKRTNRWDVVRYATQSGWGATLRLCLILIVFGTFLGGSLYAVARVVVNTLT